MDHMHISGTETSFIDIEKYLVHNSPTKCSYKPLVRYNNICNLKSVNTTAIFSILYLSLCSYYSAWMQCFISFLWALCEELEQDENSKWKFMSRAVIEPMIPIFDNMAPYTTKPSLTDNKLLFIDFSEIHENIKTQTILQI